MPAWWKQRSKTHSEGAPSSLQRGQDRTGEGGRCEHRTAHRHVRSILPSDHWTYPLYQPPKRFSTQCPPQRQSPRLAHPGDGPGTGTGGQAQNKSSLSSTDDRMEEGKGCVCIGFQVPRSPPKVFFLLSRSCSRDCQRPSPPSTDQCPLAAVHNPTPIIPDLTTTSTAEQTRWAQSWLCFPFPRWPSACCVCVCACVSPASARSSLAQPHTLVGLPVSSLFPPNTLPFPSSPPSKIIKPQTVLPFLLKTCVGPLSQDLAFPLVSILPSPTFPSLGLVPLLCWASSNCPSWKPHDQTPFLPSHSQQEVTLPSGILSSLQPSHPRAAHHDLR